MKNLSFTLLIIFCFCYGCKLDSKEENVLVFNLNTISEIEQKDFLKMNLDKNHPNLLNPDISNLDFEIVVESWTKLHSDLYHFLKDHNFKWNSKKENIKIFNKIYFTKKGKIKVYAFKILEDISEDKIIEYEKLVNEFANNAKINVKRDIDFAQCGKASLPNL